MTSPRGKHLSALVDLLKDKGAPRDKAWRTLVNHYLRCAWCEEKDPRRLRVLASLVWRWGWTPKTAGAVGLCMVSRVCDAWTLKQGIERDVRTGKGNRAVRRWHKMYSQRNCKSNLDRPGMYEAWWILNQRAGWNNEDWKKEFQPWKQESLHEKKWIETTR